MRLPAANQSIASQSGTFRRGYLGTGPFRLGQLSITPEPLPNPEFLVMPNSPKVHRTARVTLNSPLPKHFMHKRPAPKCSGLITSKRRFLCMVKIKHFKHPFQAKSILWFRFLL